MIIIRTDPFTNKSVELELNVNVEDIYDWQNGLKTLDEITPNLSVDERYFILTGVTPESYEKWEHSYNEVPEGMECVDLDIETLSLHFQHT